MDKEEITDEIVDQMIFILDSSASLSKFEADLIHDRREAFGKYGFKSRITDKQKKIIEKIYKKAKLQTMKSTIIIKPKKVKCPAR